MHLSCWGCRGRRQRWPQTGLLTGTSSFTTGTRACCSSGSEGLLGGKEGRAIVLDFFSAPKSAPRPLGPATSREGFLGCLQGVSLPEGWGDPPGRTKETNLRHRVLDGERCSVQPAGHKRPHGRGWDTVVQCVSLLETHCCVGLPALPVSCYVSLGTSPHLSRPHCLHVLDGDDDGTHPTGLKWRLNE